jgi:hypothetical protein
MYGVRLSRSLLLMHPLLMSALANERNHDLRADAAARRRSRFALKRSRRAASARRARRPFRAAHA